MTTSFSWHRLGLVARFYSPSLRLPLMIYPAVSLVIGICNFWLSKFEIGILFTGLLGLILSMMFYFFPLFFTRPASPVVETMLPAKASERLLVFVGASLIINPILTYIPYYMIEWIFGVSDQFKELKDMVDTFSQDMMKQSCFIGYAQALPPMITCLYVVLSKWKNRISSAIGFTILTIVALSIIGGIFGIFIALTEFSDLPGDDSYEVGFRVGEQLVTRMLPLVVFIGTLSVLYTALMIGLLYRRLRRQQV